MAYEKMVYLSILLSSVCLPLLVNCFCNEGFMDYDLLRKKAAQIPTDGALSSQRMSQVNATRWLFPDLRFSCQSAVITEAVIGIDIRGFDRSYPMLELWEMSESNPHHYTKVPCGTGGYTVHLTSSNSTTDTVFTIKFPIPLPVTPSHVLGLYQPSDTDSTVRFFYDDNTTSVAYRAVNVDDTEVTINDNNSTVPVPHLRLFIHTVTEPASCSEGFIELDELKSKVHLFTNVIPLFGQQRVFPNISFTCEGYVTKWIVGGLNVSGINYPRIRIGREDELSLKEAITLNLFEAVNIGLNVYEFHHKPALQVRGGDLLVMLHSGNSDVNKMVYYQAVSGPDNYDLSDLSITKLEENVYPLISVVVEKSIPVDRTSTDTSSISPTVFGNISSPVDSTNFEQPMTVERYTIALMGTIIGTLGLMLLVAVTLVIFLVLHMRRKREFAITRTHSTSTQRDSAFPNSIVLIDFSENEGKSKYEQMNDGAIKVLNGSFRGRKLIIRKSENVIENLDECDNEIHIKARISLSDGDTESLFVSELQEDNEPFEDPANDVDMLLMKLSQKQIKRQEIQIIDQFSCGQFGEITEAVWKSSAGTTIVTVNKIQNDANRLKLLQAAATVTQFNHRNIIKLHGIVVDEDPTILVFEQLSESLKEFLEKKNSSLDEVADKKLMTSFSSQIACGMEYLHRKSYIHGHLTSSNVQLSKNNNCKINGFFEAVVENSANMFLEQSITAPEVMKSGIRTREGDVWSYGNVLDDIWRLSRHHEAQEVDADNTECTQDCSDFRMYLTAMHELMLQCRDVDAGRRPDFTFLNARLLQFL